MPQDRETGAAGADYGHMMGRGLAKLLSAEKLSDGSNEVRWRGLSAVIKSCRPATSSFGVTAKMLERLDLILAAFEDERGVVQVWSLPAPKFRSAMRDSRSSSAEGGKVKLVTKSHALAEGRVVGKFSKSEIEAAART